MSRSTSHSHPLHLAPLVGLLHHLSFFSHAPLASPHCFLLVCVLPSTASLPAPAPLSSAMSSRFFLYSFVFVQFFHYFLHFPICCCARPPRGKNRPTPCSYSLHEADVLLVLPVFAALASFLLCPRFHCFSTVVRFAYSYVLRFRVVWFCSFHFAADEVALFLFVFSTVLRFAYSYVLRFHNVWFQVADDVDVLLSRVFSTVVRFAYSYVLRFQVVWFCSFHLANDDVSLFPIAFSNVLRFSYSYVLRFQDVWFQVADDDDDALFSFSFSNSVRFSYSYVLRFQDVWFRFP